VGWVELPQAYVQPTRQLAIRKRKKTGDWSYTVLVFTLTNAILAELTGCPIAVGLSSSDTLFAALHLYDLRDGGLET
jgi:hypothetical protein